MRRHCETAMQAQETRIGGRHMARERGAFDREPKQLYRPEARGSASAPLSEFIDELTLNALMAMRDYLPVFEGRAA